MSETLKLHANACVLVGDGRKAILLRNKGDEMFANLEVQHVFEAQPNPPTREQGTDRPGRTVSGSRRSAVEQTDWHEIGEKAFIDTVIDALAAVHREDPVRELVIVAPPRTLAEVRHALPRELASATVREIHKDLCHLPVYEIEKYLTAA